MYIIGIDPGSKGGWALFKENGLEGAGPMKGLAAVCRELVSYKCHAYVEELGPIRHQGIKGPYGQGRNLGLVLGVLWAFEIPHTIVSPKDWQEAFMMQGKKKGMDAPSIAAAKALWPTQFGPKAKDGETDAAFIGYFGALNHETLANP